MYCDKFLDNQGQPWDLYKIACVMVPPNTINGDSHDVTDALDKHLAQRIDYHTKDLGRVCNLLP